MKNNEPLLLPPPDPDRWINVLIRRKEENKFIFESNSPAQFNPYPVMESLMKREYTDLLKAIEEEFFKVIQNELQEKFKNGHNVKITVPLHHHPFFATIIIQVSPEDMRKSMTTQNKNDIKNIIFESFKNIEPVGVRGFLSDVISDYLMVIWKKYNAQG